MRSFVAKGKHQTGVIGRVGEGQMIGARGSILHNIYYRTK